MAHNKKGRTAQQQRQVSLAILAQAFDLGIVTRNFFANMLRERERLKRVFASILLALARRYHVLLADVNRDSSEEVLDKAYRRVILKCHPDKGGSGADQARLNDARDRWKGAGKSAKAPGRPKGKRKKTGEGVESMSVSAAHFFGTPGYRIQGVAVLLTYQSFSELEAWDRFVAFVELKVSYWKVKHWCCTMETNQSGTYHFHLMLQFREPQDRNLSKFVFEGHKPNGRQQDG